MYVIAFLALCLAMAIIFVPASYKSAKTLPKVDVTPAQSSPPSQPVAAEKETAKAQEPASTDQRPQEKPTGPAGYDRPGTEKKGAAQAKGASEPKTREKSRGSGAVINHERLAGLYNDAVKEGEMGNRAGAQRIYQTILAEHPSHIESLNNLGVLAMAEGNRKEAIFYFNRILQHKNDYGKAYNNLGLLMMQEGDNRLAEEYFRKAIEIEKGSIEPTLNLAALLRNEKRHEEASRLLEGLIAANTRSRNLYLSYALIKDEMGRHEEAIKYYKAYLREGGSPGERNEVVKRLKVIENNQPSKIP